MHIRYFLYPFSTAVARYTYISNWFEQLLDVLVPTLASFWKNRDQNEHHQGVGPCELRPSRAGARRKDGRGSRRRNAPDEKELVGVSGKAD